MLYLLGFVTYDLQLIEKQFSGLLSTELVLLNRIEMSFHQKSRKFFFYCNLSGIKLYISVATSWKKWKETIKYLKSRWCPFLTPLKFNKSHTWSFYKLLDIASCDRYDLSVLCLLYFIKSLISRSHFPFLLSQRRNTFRLLYNH